MEKVNQLEGSLLQVLRRSVEIMMEMGISSTSPLLKLLSWCPWDISLSCSFSTVRLVAPFNPRGLKCVSEWLWVRPVQKTNMCVMKSFRGYMQVLKIDCQSCHRGADGMLTGKMSIVLWSWYEPEKNPFELCGTGFGCPQQYCNNDSYMLL